MMRVRLVICGRLETMTGGYLYDRRLAAHLRRRDCPVTVVTVPGRSWGRQLLANASGRLAAALAAGDGEVILEDALAHPALIGHHRRLRRRRQAPVVALVHQVLSAQPRAPALNRLLRAVEARYFASVDAFVFNSRTTRAAVRCLAGRDIPAVVAPPGGDRLGRLPAARLGQRLAVRAVASGPLSLLFAGNLTPVKGLVPLIEALAGLPAGTWRLTVAGSLHMDPRHVAAIRRLLARRGLEQRVHLAGLLDASRLTAAFGESDLLTMPYAHEGCGIALMEAMAHGLPVVASRRGAAGELVRHGETGWLVAPGDHEALRELLLRLHADRARLVEASRDAWRASQHAPRWESSMAAVHQFLQQLTAAESAGRSPGDGR